MPRRLTPSSLHAVDSRLSRSALGSWSPMAYRRQSHKGSSPVGETQMGVGETTPRRGPTSHNGELKAFCPLLEDRSRDRYSDNDDTHRRIPQSGDILW